MKDVVIVGGGQAAVSLIGRLRELDPGRRITLVCGEPHLPYQRPPLSKKYLTGEFEQDRLTLKPREWFDEQKAVLHLGRVAEGIDLSDRRVALAGGERIAFDDLAFCTGSDPRRLPAAIGRDLGRVYTLRGIADVDCMRAELQPGRRVLVVGGGYIGLEAAAVCAKAGLKVTLIEAAPRILQRVASEATSDFFRELHRSHGVDLREGTGLSGLAGNGAVERAVFSTGEEIPVDFVLVGIGITPCDRLAAEAGLKVDNGIVVDEFCRTSDSHVFAAGDCANLPYRGRRIRLESVQNAIDQGEAAATVIAGGAEPYDPKPWFWSDQYDIKLQIGGLNAGYDSTIVRPGKRPGTQSVWYFGGGTLLAVDAMNDPASYMVGRKLIEAGITPEREKIADPAFPLNTLMPR
ncbi:MAG: NAD(P)/FAD-dependent oxidoreductase [Parvibaculaceae bacterium]